MNSVKPTLIVSNIELNLIPMLQLKLLSFARLTLISAFFC